MKRYTTLFLSLAVVATVSGCSDDPSDNATTTVITGGGDTAGDPSGGDTGGQTEGGSAEGASADGVGADSGTDDGGETGGDGGAAAPFCARTCTEATDCCTVAEGCGEYPQNFECVAGFCESGGCTDDQQCVDTSGGFTDSCRDVGGFPTCVTSCTADTDCTAPFVCLDEGYCGSEDTGEGCTSDADCFPGVCDTATGTCTCSSDDDCTAVEGYGCNMG